ncbi:uncharacterized protein YndB with AHSA1/START domain [Nocardioides daedukensis]|uniref:Uncharacterized protein YndB with AHSA1/START domain n=1 Tax=Nocardioides daedukensis TaxID=634462 RepID=A0A7Y9S4P3_9ACTN|nr:uncharacterized protein YndB with AHSA1/START domain [Nocardioides daedukensis]
MSFTLDVDFAASPAEAFALLSDPVRRPEWQSSLRTVQVLTEGPPRVGTRWHDVTWPGLRPLMEITVFEPEQRWAERGTWRGVTVDLLLDFVATPTGTRVTATCTAYAVGLLRPVGPVLDRLGPLAARDDLRRAARIVSAA